MKITIDIISDVVCPWCFVGKRRLERAMEAMRGKAEFEVHWHPFELNPNMPAAGMERDAYRAAKFGSLERSRELDARMAQVGGEEGIRFALDRLQRTPNTLDAHRTIAFAAATGREDATVEALFRAYFTQGVDLTERNDILDVAAHAGLDREALAKHLESTAGIAEVREAEENAQRRNVQGVPHFTVTGGAELHGAQPPEAFLEVFESVLRGEVVPPAPTNTRFLKR